jgi:uncharacterized protein YggE
MVLKKIQEANKCRRIVMKKGVLLVLGLILIAGLVLSGCSSDSNASSTGGQGVYGPENIKSYALGEGYQQTGVWVTGTGKVTVVPDIAVLSLGVEAQSTTVSEAQTDAAGAMTDVMAVLTGNGIADKDIQTQWYSIAPVTRWIDDYKEQITIGYRVTNTVTVKIRDIDRVGTIIDAITAAAGDLTRVNSINFTVDDTESYYDEAREKAVLDAMDKAEQIAAVAHFTLGNPIYVSETGGPFPPVVYPVRDFGYTDGAEATTPISVGELEINVTVQMAFTIQ